jgi:2-haloacid dehalogenase
MIRNIVFDFGGVLVDWNPRYFYRNIFETEEEMEYFLTNVCTPEWNTQTDAEMTFAEAIEMLVPKFPQYEREIRLYFEGWSEMLHAEIPESLTLKASLRAEGYRLYGLTNWSAETMPLAKEKFTFMNGFDGVVVSGDEGIKKPDPKIFHLLLDRYNLRPEETVFFDDHIENIIAARELGIHGILFKNAEQAEQDLKLLVETINE